MARFISRQISEIELAFELAFAFEFEMHKKCNKVFQLSFLCILIYCEMGIEIKIQDQLQFFSPVHKTCQKFGEFAKSKFNFRNLTTNEPGPYKIVLRVLRFDSEVTRLKGRPIRSLTSFRSLRFGPSLPASAAP